MLKEVVSEYLRTNIEMSSTVNNNTSIVNLTPSVATQLKTSLVTLYPGAVVHSLLICQSIDVRANITAVNEFIYPDSVYDVTKSAIEKNSDLLKSLWEQPRRELNLVQNLDGSTWLFRGAVALPNRVRSGAYYYESMTTIMTDGGAYETQQNELLGIQLVSNTWGLLSGLDKILISFNWELRHTIFTA